MRIIPAMDVMGGAAVRGVGGRRTEYRPVRPISDPLALAASFRSRFGFAELYLADLDAIGGVSPGFDLYRRLRSSGFQLWVDAGVRDTADVDRIADEADVVVVGLETLRGPLRELRVAADRAAFSLDMNDRKPIGSLAAWESSEPLEIVERVVEVGIRRIIVLDLARVGSAAGVDCEDLCANLIARFPEIELTVGGGIRDWNDIRRLEALGVSQVLVASALHDGRL